MAQRIIGLDIGSYALKTAYVESTFRGFQLVDHKERRVAAEEGGPEGDREALLAWLAEERGQRETVVCAVPGDAVMTRILTLPFKERRRINEVIGFELEGYLPYGIEDVIYDYQILEQTDEGTRLFAVATPRQTLERYLEALKSVGLDPKVVSFGPWPYFNYAPYLKDDPEVPVAIVDVGHKRTDVCILRRGKVEFVRTLSRAGAHVNEVVARRLGIDVHEADLRKRRDGRLPPIATAGGFGATPGDPLVSALEEGMRDVARDVRLALLSYQTESAQVVGKVYLCGGSVRLAGTIDHFAAQLATTVEPFDVAGLEFNKMANPGDGAEVIAKGVALAIRGQGGGAASEINLRRGPYAFQGEFRYLREKVTVMVIMVIALLGIAGFRAYTRYSSLEAQRAAQVEELAALSKDLLGKPTEDFDAVLQKLKTGAGDFESPFPAIEAFDLFYEITEALDEVNKTPRPTAAAATEGDVPPGEGAHDKPPPLPDDPLADPEAVDGEPPADPEAARPPDDRYVIELEGVRIDKTVGTLKGQANDIEAYEQFFQRLKAHRCLKKVETQDTDIVTFQRHTGWRQFQVQFQIDCSEKKKPKSAKAEKPAPAKEAAPAGTDEAAGTDESAKKEAP